jgi:hypothetical protein
MILFLDYDAWKVNAVSFSQQQESTGADGIFGKIKFASSWGFTTHEIDLTGWHCSILNGPMARYMRLSFTHLTKFYVCKDDLPLTTLDRVSMGEFFFKVPRVEARTGQDMAKHILRATAAPSIENYEGGELAVPFRDLHQNPFFVCDNDLRDRSRDTLVDLEMEELMAVSVIVASSVHPNVTGLTRCCLTALRVLLEQVDDRFSRWFLATEEEITARNNVQDFVKSEIGKLSATSREAQHVLKEGKPFSYFIYDTTSGAGEKVEGIIPSWRLFWVSQTKYIQGTDHGISTMVTQTQSSALLLLDAGSCGDA